MKRKRRSKWYRNLTDEKGKERRSTTKWNKWIKEENERNTERGKRS